MRYTAPPAPTESAPPPRRQTRRQAAKKFCRALRREIAANITAPPLFGGGELHAAASDAQAAAERANDTRKR